MIVRPNAMAGWDLAQYIQHLAETANKPNAMKLRFGKAFLRGRAGDDVLALPFASCTALRRRQLILCRVMIVSRSTG